MNAADYCAYANEFSDDFSENLRDFIKRYPSIKQCALEDIQKQVMDAKDCLAMLKLTAKMTTEPEQKVIQNNLYGKALKNYTEKATQLNKLNYYIEHYIGYIRVAQNINYRSLIDDALPTCDTFEKFVSIVNKAHYTQMCCSMRHIVTCPCSADEDTFQSELYIDHESTDHIFIPGRNICSYGTKMKVLNPEQYFTKFIHFLDNSFIVDSSDLSDEVRLDIVATL